jgi:hypothetical protein
MIWDPPTAILLTQGELDSIMNKPGESRKATIGEIDAALSSHQLQTENRLTTIKNCAAITIAPFMRWYHKRDANAFSVQFAALVGGLIAVIWMAFAATAAAYADDICRASGAWVRCQGIELKADDIEGVEIVNDGEWGQKVLTVRYAGSTEIVQVGAAHLDEALALLDRPKPK